MVALANVGSRLALARSLAGSPGASSVSKVACLAGGHVWLIENGKIENPSVETVTNLARVFGVPVEWLLLGVGSDPKPRTVRRAWERAQREWRETRAREAKRAA